MKYIIILLLLPSFSFSQTKPQDQRPLHLAPVFVKDKCDTKHHVLNSTAMTYPPCYDCACGRHLFFDTKMYMALEVKYGDSLDKVVSRYMRSGDWYTGKKLMDSIEVESLGGKHYRDYQKSIDSIYKKQ